VRRNWAVQPKNVRRDMASHSSGSLLGWSFIGLVDDDLLLWCDWLV